jgi:hypothetical protein
MEGDDCKCGIYLLLTLPQPIIATRIFLISATAANDSSDASKDAAPAEAAKVKNCERDMC